MQISPVLLRKGAGVLSLSLLALTSWAQMSFRFEAETGVSTLRLPSPYRTGWHVRQQLTTYLRPRLGLALGVGWGGSANNDPLSTRDPASPQYSRPDPRALLDFYDRQEQMTDLSIAWLPVLSRRHQVKVQAGLSLQRRREVNIDSIFYEDPRSAYYDALPTYTDQRRVMPMVALGYDLRLSNRWAVGANAVAYLPAADRPTTTLGIRATYRFTISRDSLGIIGRLSEPATWGLRGAINRVGDNAGANGNSRNITRFSAGIWATYPLSLTWALRGEVTWAGRGYEYVNGNSRTLTDAQYLELPLLFRHEVGERWHLFAGPYLAFLLTGTNQLDRQTRQSLESHVNSGLLIGTEYRVSNRLALDLRYQRDLVQLSNTPYNSTYHSYQLGLNWAIR